MHIDLLFLLPLFVISVLDCDPHLDDIKELIHELNKTNGLFKFVRIMRQKFQEAAAQGINRTSYVLLKILKFERWQELFSGGIWAGYFY